MTTEFEVTQVRKVHACCEVFIMVDVIRHFPCYGDVQLLWKVKMHSASKKVPYNFHTITSRS